METKILLETLRTHPFLEGFRPEDIENLAGMAFQARFETDQVIFREGDESSFFYLVGGGEDRP